MANPLVSIVIPTYNSAEFISETLTACLAQTYQPCEIILVDDGSQDNTLDIVNSFAESIRVIQQTNQGPAIARNTGILEAKGDFIQFCDSDDILHPEKIEKCLSLLLDNPSSALAYCQMQSVDEAGQIITDRLPVPNSDFFEADKLFCKIFDANGSPIQTSTLLARKSALIAVGLYRADPNYFCAEDWDLLLRLADSYSFVGIQEVLVDYRVRTGALTTKPILMAEGRLKTVQYARDYSQRSQCINDAEYDQIEAGRYQVLAVKLWQGRRNKEARQAFLQASKLSPKGRKIRLLYAYMTYFLPISAMYWLNQRLSA
ncbi:MAG: hypothetical protein Phog2KO_37290 [Phototrophicaceae bacterium]